MYKDKQEIVIKGWVKTNRSSNKIGFIIIYNGKDVNGVQVVYKNDIKDFANIKNAKSFSPIEIKGIILLTPNRPQPFEVLAKKLLFLDNKPEDFQIQNKVQTLEFLRENLHLRTNTTLFRSIFKIRSGAMFAIENFFNKKEFTKVTTPIITENDAEGAGETFIVTTRKDGNYSKDFFAKKASLTVSGQLAAESLAQTIGNVYTFGPTFRAENSNTIRHVAEFWMLEPEIPFASLKEGMANAEELVIYVVNYILENFKKEIDFLNEYHKDIKLLESLTKISKLKKFKKVSYTEVIDILKKAKVKFEENNIKFGLDLGIEHEKYLVDNYFKQPVFIYDYPKNIKAFYMYLNEDKKTVAAFDLLVPHIGELVGGSQRESRIDILNERIKSLKIDPSSLQWYIDLRKNGYAPSVGYGLGFERLVMLLTGVNNIKDALPFPRYPKNLKF